MRCPHCGAEIDDNLINCPECGNTVSETNPTAAEETSAGLMDQAKNLAGKVRTAWDGVREKTAPLQEDYYLDLKEQEKQQGEESADRLEPGILDVFRLFPDWVRGLKGRTLVRKDILGILAVLIVLGLFIRGNLKTHISLNDYLTIECSGLDGYATAEAVFDEEKFAEDWEKKLKIHATKQVEEQLGYESGESVAALLTAKCIDGRLDRTEGVQNGDTLMYLWDCDDDTARQDFHVVLEYETVEQTVSGLQNAAEEGIIFPDSDTREITAGDLMGLSREDIQSAYNEILARHGYIFHKQETLEKYQQYDWYAPLIQPDDFKLEELSETEQKNLKFLKMVLKQLS